MNKPLLECIAEGWTVVTAGARLARRLHARFGRARLEAGHRAWETPDILPFPNWLDRTWRRKSGDDTRLQLHPVQEQALWLRIIEASRYRRRLLLPHAASRQAAAARQTLQEWLAPGFPRELTLNEDARAFQAWQRDFESRCREADWIDAARLGPELLAGLGRGRVRSEPRIVFAGFDECTPLRRELMKALRDNGTRVLESAPEPRRERLYRCAFADRRAEIRAAALWVRHRLETEKFTSIGIVMPDLAERRRQVQNIFDDVLLPGSLLEAPGSGVPPYLVSGGEPLSHRPMVMEALSVLALGSKSIPLAEAGLLLRSPYLHSDPKEAVEHARVDEYLRGAGQAHVDLRAMRRAVRSAGRDMGRVLALGARLDDLRKFLAKQPHRQSVRDWARCFSRLVIALGWPGGRPLDSMEYQAAEAWRECLGNLAALDPVTGPMTYHAALAELSRILADTAFQPRTGEAPVEVLGMTGAAEPGFDGLWVMGLDAGVWPPSAQPNPFIPLALQRQLDMPRGTPESTLRFARALTRRLADSAREVIFSHPQSAGEAPLRPSPLLSDFPFSESAPAPEMGDYLAQVHAGRKVERFRDDRAPSIPPGTRVRGGTSLFKDQSACPFRAFARHRLGARALDTVDVGLNAMVRGSLVHWMLEQVWEKLGSRNGLLALDPSSLAAVLAEAAEHALTRLRRERPGVLSPRFADLERARLCTLAAEWLELERRRPDFTVEDREKRGEAEIEGLKVRTQIDRVDRLPDGRRLILDYKTGSAHAGVWFGVRPEEPQLPFYALAGKEATAGIVFALVRSGECAFVGLAKEDGIIDGVKPVEEHRLGREFGGWEELIEYWQRVLRGLAAEFRDGEARVDPRSPQDCRQCDLHALCRINESAPQWETDDE